MRKVGKHMIIYVAKSGETVSEIAERYGVSAINLAADNGLFPDTRLLSGEALAVLIPETVHTVMPNETLFSVARRYGTTAVQLLRNNFKLGGLARISAGDELVINYQEKKPTKTFAVNSYAYPFISEKLLREHLPYLTYLTPFTYGITSGGNLVIPNDEFLINTASDYGVNTLLHLSTLTEGGNFSSERASLVFNNLSAADTLVSEIISVISEKGFDGADVDFEFINPDESDLYIEFLKKLKLRLTDLGLPLFSALAPKTSDTQRGYLYEGHNYGGIGSAVDYVLLMTYEWGYTYGPPLAVAPINNVRRVVEYALTRIPPEKLYLGIPTYGYDWTLPYEKGNDGAPSISPVEALNIARKYNSEILYDETAQSPYFRYIADDGKEHEVWFEDVRSITKKLELADEFKLFGIGYWNSMRDFPQNWVTLNAKYNILNYSLL